MKKTYDPLASVQAAGPPGTISFVYGLPDPATFPSQDLRWAAAKVLKERASLALQYGPEQGYGPLIDSLIKKFRQSDGLDIGRPQIMLTGGASQALDHICSMRASAGDTVLVEAPSYHEALALFRNHGLRLRQIPVDEEGIQAEPLDRCLFQLRKKRVAFLYLIPSFQNPAGTTISLPRRKAILDICRRRKIMIVEDDVYRDLIYEGRKLPSLFSLDRAGLVIHLGSFSKIMAPGLRLGWMLACPDRIQGFYRSGLRGMGGGANPFIANILADYCQEGLLEPHIESLKDVYRKRRDRLLQCLEKHMMEKIIWTRPAGGFFVWLQLAKPLCSNEAVVRARTAGVRFLAGDAFFAEQPTGQHLRLSFSYVEPKKIELGIRKAAAAIKTELARKLDFHP